MGGSVLGGRWSDRVLTRLKAKNGGVGVPEVRIQPAVDGPVKGVNRYFHSTDAPGEHEACYDPHSVGMLGIRLALRETHPRGRRLRRAVLYWVLRNVGASFVLLAV